jgi:hypothetical protein
MEVLVAAAAAAVVDDVDADGESLLALTSCWTTLVEALRCLSPLILTISRVCQVFATFHNLCLRSEKAINHSVGCRILPVT